MSNQEKREEWIPLERSKSKEKHKVSGDLHVMVHLNVRTKPRNKPPKEELPSSPDVDHHRFYKELLFKLLQAEQSISEENENGISSPSESSQKLLTEYGIRFGVGETYRQLVYLELLMDYFVMKRDHLSEILSTLNHLKSLEEGGYRMTKKEATLYNNLVSSGSKRATVQSQVENILSNYRFAFRKLKMDGSLEIICHIFCFIHGDQGMDMIRGHVVVSLELHFTPSGLCQKILSSS